MFAGDYSRRSKEPELPPIKSRENRTTPQRKRRERLRVAKIDIDLETLVAMGIAAVVTRPRKRWRQPVRRTQK